MIVSDRVHLVAKSQYHRHVNPRVLLTTVSGVSVRAVEAGAGSVLFVGTKPEKSFPDISFERMVGILDYLVRPEVQIPTIAPSAR